MTLITISKICPWCQKPAEVQVDKQAFAEYLEHKVTGGPKRHAQVAFPNLSADQREILISGAHPKCWEELFGPGEEFDDDEEENDAE